MNIKSDYGNKEEEDEGHIANEFRSSSWKQMMKMTIAVKDIDKSPEDMKV